MVIKGSRASAVFLCSFFSSFGLVAQENPATDPLTVSCLAGTGGAQNICPTDTSSGVVLVKNTGSEACILGRNWGYDDNGIWVKDGCSGDFIVSRSSSVQIIPAAETTSASAMVASTAVNDENEAWGYFAPGSGLLLGRSDYGEATLSGYALLRYMDQRPEDQTFVDHNGNTNPVDTRRDIYSHRVIVSINGWVADPRLVYNFIFWTVNTTDQDALFANIGYRFNKKFNLYGGINGNPGSRTMFGSHPYWLGTDRVMAEEFFRPFFTMGIWANGEIMPGLWYSGSVGNTSSTLGVKATQIDRDFTYGGSMWWMPTTHEFGPRGGLGDWENHQELATRFGVSVVASPEERYTGIGEDPGNTVLKLADSLNVFSTGSLAPGVTVTNTDYQIISLDAGFKYKGMFFQTELYRRVLDSFEANGILPVSEITDTGFYIQTAFFAVPKKLEFYLSTSQIYGDDDAGFGDSSEYLVGMNYYPWDTRNNRLNVQLIDVNHSPVGSTFGYYTGGQDGTTFSVGFSVFF